VKKRNKIGSIFFSQEEEKKRGGTPPDKKKGEKPTDLRGGVFYLRKERGRGGGVPYYLGERRKNEIGKRSVFSQGGRKGGRGKDYPFLTEKRREGEDSYFWIRGSASSYREKKRRGLGGKSVYSLVEREKIAAKKKGGYSSPERRRKKTLFSLCREMKKKGGGEKFSSPSSGIMGRISKISLT